MSKKEQTILLQRRLEAFTLNTIRAAESGRVSFAQKHIWYQLLRSTSSIGANYAEAQNAESSQDFTHKVGISRKEALESCYWLRILKQVWPGDEDVLEELILEAEELTKITSAIYWKSKSSQGVRYR